MMRSPRDSAKSAPAPCSWIILWRPLKVAPLPYVPELETNVEPRKRKRFFFF